MELRFQKATPRRPDGLEGEAPSLAELAEVARLEVKGRTKRALDKALGVTKDATEQGIRAVVRRTYERGEVICRAGEYGSTAFLLVEGSAEAVVPAAASTVPAAVPGRSRGALGRLAGIFRRRHTGATRTAPSPVDVGEVTRYAGVAAGRPAPAALGPGDLFGIDTCINFYPREATVTATSRVVALEMLRSVLDAIREGGTAKGDVAEAYQQAAIRNALATATFFEPLTDEERERIAAAATLVDADSDDVQNDDVLYAEGEPANAIYVVRAGTIRFSQRRSRGDVVLGYLGRGAVFGVETLLPEERFAPIVLRTVSHPGLFPTVELDRTLSLGRATGTDVPFPLEARTVSRKQARIELRGDERFLVNLASANPTLLNGQPVEEARLREGDRISVLAPEGGFFEFEVARAPFEDLTGRGPGRLATAAALDSFEVVKVPVPDLLAATARNARFLEHATSVARSLESLTARLGPQRPPLVDEVVELDLYNSQNALLIDLDRCTRCDECVRACSDAHGGVARFTRDGPRFGRYLVTMACRSCTDPKCMVGCPVGSIRRLASLEVRIEDWCVGCQKCATSCPFGNINMVDLDDGGGRAVVRELERDPGAPAPERAPNLKATVCDLCAGYDGPSCVYACPHDAAIRVNPTSFLTPVDRS